MHQTSFLATRHLAEKTPRLARRSQREDVSDETRRHAFFARDDVSRHGDVPPRCHI